MTPPRQILFKREHQQSASQNPLPLTLYDLRTKLFLLWWKQMHATWHLSQSSRPPQPTSSISKSHCEELISQTEYLRNYQSVHMWSLSLKEIEC
mmetsp:Transcript_23300/g.28162  ORF Transcript_23300/g.28162 Transcript_23300/m.28162 type:complete len:94 (+) Transcript_23300:390-671(+)